MTELKMQRALEIKVNIPVCSGCRLCEMVCPIYHDGVVNPERSRIRITDKYSESLFEPHICQLCPSPAPCVESCPMGALNQSQATGVISIDHNQCNGCMACVEACPYDAIWWSEGLEKLSICDRCDGHPTCVQFCTSGAIQLTKVD